MLLWVSKQKDDQLNLSVVTLGEIERGIVKGVARVILGSPMNWLLGLGA